MTTASPAHCYNQNGPYPWEEDFVDDEHEVMMEEEPIPELVFSPEDRYHMLQQAQYLRVSQSIDDGDWAAVAYGIGLASFGRRDLEFSVEDLHLLPGRIQTLWEDHIRVGHAAVHFVVPQLKGYMSKSTLRSLSRSTMAWKSHTTGARC